MVSIGDRQTLGRWIMALCVSVPMQMEMYELSLIGSVRNIVLIEMYARMVKNLTLALLLAGLIPGLLFSEKNVDWLML